MHQLRRSCCGARSPATSCELGALRRSGCGARPPPPAAAFPLRRSLGFEGDFTVPRNRCELGCAVLGPTFGDFGAHTRRVTFVDPPRPPLDPPRERTRGPPCWSMCHEADAPPHLCGSRSLVRREVAGRTSPALGASSRWAGARSSQTSSSALLVVCWAQVVLGIALLGSLCDGTAMRE